MTKIENSEFKVEMKLKAIELLNSSLNAPLGTNNPISNFNFNIKIETKADASNKLVFVIVSIEIKNDDQSVILGSISLSCIYEIENFENLITINSENEVIIPQPLIEILNSISISTMRGVMFSTFKGTFLHSAFLPIIDPRQIRSID